MTTQNPADHPPRVLPDKVRQPLIRAMDRPRVSDGLGLGSTRQLLVVSAPAGSGKTTFVATLCAAREGAVAWYRVEGSDDSEGAFLRHLGAAVGKATGVAHEWTTVAHAVQDIDRRAGDLIVVLDDLHEICGTEAERAVGEFVSHLPRRCTAIVTTRRSPGFDLSRLRVSDRLVEVGADDLRFRSWEIERLFADVYDDPLRPDELANLERKTGGWAAGLQLFHLATAGKAVSERRALLSSLGSKSPTVNEYLARNVLRDLPPPLLSFLLDTCVLSAMTPELCDRFRGTDNSQEMLRELVERNVFTVWDINDGSYRYHDVLRSYLEARLLEQHGETELRMTFREAGKFLESQGRDTAAVNAYSRAGDQSEVERILFRCGQQLASDPGRWIDALPPALRDEDPWVLLARARALVSDGRLTQARRRLDEAMERFGAAAGAEICRRERRWVSMWLDHEPYNQDGWRGHLRSLVRSGPGLTANLGPAAGSHGFVRGFRELLSGNENVGVEILASTASDVDVTPVVSTLAELVSVVMPGIYRVPDSSHLLSLAERFRTLSNPWCERVALAARALDSAPEHLEWTERAVTQAIADGDDWFSTLARTFCAVGRLRCGDGNADDFGELAADYRRLDAAAFEPIMLAMRGLVLYLEESEEAVEGCQRAEAAARARGLGSVQALSTRVMQLSDPTRRRTSVDRNESVGSVDNHGFLSSVGAYSVGDAGGTEPAQADPAVELRCFGTLRLTLDGEPTKVGELKPRVRSLLCALTLSQGQPVHRDRLAGMLWPTSSDSAAIRSLQVAVSALRKFFEPTAARGTSQYVVRQGDSYELALPPGSRCDLREFEELLSSHESGDAASSVERLTAALDLYRGELHEAEGAAEWIVGPRQRLADLAVSATAELARLLLERGDHRDAIAACRRGLAIDRYRDELWQRLIQGLEDASEPAEAARVRSEYQDVLAELGLDQEPRH